MIYDSKRYIAIHELIIQGVSYSTIASMLNVTKNTVSALKKRDQETGSIFPARTRISKYDPYIRELSLRISHYINRKRRTCQLHKTTKLSMEDVYALVLADGFIVTKTKFAELYKIEYNKQKESFLRIHYRPGEIVEFDWGYRLLNINGANRRVYWGVFTFPYSNYRLAYVAEKEDGQSFASVFQSFINDVGGIAPTLVIDNMKIAKRSHDPTLTDKQLTLLFEELSKHYSFEVFFCSPGRPNQKGNVENGVKIIKTALKQSYINGFQNLAEVQEFVDYLLKKKNSAMHSSKNDTCQNLYTHEKALLRNLPKKSYTYYALTKRTVNRDSIISFRNSNYSIPEGYQDHRITIRYNDKLIYVLTDTGDILAKHILSKKKKTNTFYVWHMLHRLHIKSKGFIYSEEYRSMPKWLKNIYIEVFMKDTISFILFLKKAEGKRKDFLKKCMQRNQISLNLVTPAILEKEINRL